MYSLNDQYSHWDNWGSNKCGKTVVHYRRKGMGVVVFTTVQGLRNLFIFCGSNIPDKNSKSIGAKGQLISKVIVHDFPYSKKPTKKFTFFALVSKMGLIKKIQAFIISKNSNY